MTPPEAFGSILPIWPDQEVSKLYLHSPALQAKTVPMYLLDLCSMKKYDDLDLRI
jgi:hypothetical protein